MHLQASGKFSGFILPQILPLLLFTEFSTGVKKGEGYNVMSIRKFVLFYLKNTDFSFRGKEKVSNIVLNSLILQ